MFRNVLYISLSIFLFVPVCIAGGMYDASEPEEIFLNFRYRQIVNTVVTGIYYDKTVYLPLGELLFILKINHNIDVTAGTVTGFFITEDTRYLLDLKAGKARMGREIHTIDTTRMIRNDAEFFVRPALFEKVFGLHFTVHLSNLSLHLVSEYTLPVLRRHQQRLQNRYAEPFKVMQPHAPLKYNRNRSWLNGGVIDYRLMTVQDTDGRQQYSYAFNGGIEVAGGDLQVSTLGGYSPGMNHTNTTRYRWRYVLDDTGYLSQITLGEVFTDGIVRTSLYGFQATNHPVEPRRIFATYLYSDKTEPEWEAELYINDRLFAATVADETGRYYFDIPLIYGSSRLEVRTYGPGGGYGSVRRRIEIPYTFLPPGDIYYTVNVGRTFYTDRTVVQARTYAGISRVVSVSAGLEYHDDMYGSRPAGFASVTLRPGMQYLIDLDIAPSLYYRSRVEVMTGMRSRIGASYTGYADSFHRYNVARLQQQFDAYGSFPFEIGRREYFMRLSGGYQQSETRSIVRSSIDMATSVNGTGITAGLHASQQSFGITNRFRTDISAGVLYRIRGDHFLKNAIIRTRLAYNTRRNTFDNLTIAISRSIGRGGRIEAQYNWSGLYGGHSFNLRLNFDFPSFRSTSNAWQNGPRTSFSQQIRGSVAYNSNNHDFVFRNNAMVGSGMASIRFFIDEDGSGMYDKGEPVVANVPVRFRNAVSSEQNGDGSSYAYRLRPYVRYSVDIREDKIPDPLLVPSFHSFSFVVDPHSFKSIDIPLHVTGEISGSVSRQAGSEYAGTNGLRLIIKNTENGEEDIVRTFSDGTYYHMGLRPGQYTVSMDPDQLSKLELVSEPDQYAVAIEATNYGDYFDGLDFVLREKSEPVEPDADTVTGDYMEIEFETEHGYCVYVVRKYPLESLWVIAECMYGTPLLWPKIWLSNYEKIKHPDLIYPDQIFTIPPKSPLTEKERSLLDRYYIVYR